MSAAVIVRLTENTHEAHRVVEVIREMVTSVSQIGPLDYEVWVAAPDVDLDGAVADLKNRLNARLGGWRDWVAFPGYPD